MTPLLSLRKLFRFTGALGLVAIAVLALVPGPARPHVLTSGGSEHFFAYGLTGLFVIGSYWSTVRPLFLSLFMSFYAGFLELCQLAVAGRDAKLIDFGLSALGVWTAFALLAIFFFFTAANRRFWKTKI